jgi:uncharacterized membrane protein YjgN (DUF898 family)
MARAGRIADSDMDGGHRMKGKIVFTGHFLEYFIMSLGLLLLCVITFGIALPYYAYWNFKYFFSNMEIEIDPSAIR